MDKFKPLETIGEISQAVVGKIDDLDTADILRQASKLPGVMIKREQYLRKELKNHYSAEIVDIAVSANPAYAGIEREEINKIAKRAINYETNKVSAISFAAGLPGGLAMAATVPADILQYFGFVLRIMQKLVYLYGFEEFSLNDANIDDGTMNDMMIFLGIMFGVQEANAAVKIVADLAAKRVAKQLANKALTKGAVYPIVKKIVIQLGGRMTRQIFANNVAKVVPVVGGVVTGGLTYATFKPCAMKLRRSLEALPISDPDFYGNSQWAYPV